MYFAFFFNEITIHFLYVVQKVPNIHTHIDTYDGCLIIFEDNRLLIFKKISVIDIKSIVIVTSTKCIIK